MTEEAAARALRLVTADPVQARALARDAARQARRHGDAAALAVAERALGLVARELHDAPTALRHLRRAWRVADAAGLTGPSAEVRMSLALVLAEAGRPREALREIDAAAPVLHGLPGARLQMQRALILYRLGRSSEAMAGYTAAIAVFRRYGDRLWEARALANRGVQRTYQGAIRQAEADLLAAEALHLAGGQELAVAQVRHNLGFVAARAGDVPGALRWYDLADEYFVRTVRPPEALMDRAELLLDARLLPEARAAAEAALAAARAGRLWLFDAQARLMLAEAALAAGDAAAAAEQAEAARRAFVRQGRPAWAALARYASLRAAKAGTGTGLRARRLLEVAEDLDRAGWIGPALDVRLYLASATGDAELAAAQLRLVRAAGRRGPAALRARAWHAEATLRDRSGDTAGARRALRAGIEVVERYRASLGATELRTLASGYATDLAGTGLRLALRDGPARSVLWWAECGKAAALRLSRTVPDRAGGTAVAEMAELRQVAAELASAVGDARPRGVLLRRQRVLEERVRRLAWQATSRGTGPGRVVGLERLPAVLGDRVLVEMVVAGADLYAVVVADGRFRVARLCRYADAEAELLALRFSLRRLVLAHGTPRSLATARVTARHGAGVLDRLLFEAVRPWLGGAGLVLVPTGALHATPWSLLAACRGRPVTVAPSASVLVADAAAVPRKGSGVEPVLVAGPDLTHARPEVEQLAGLLAPAQVFSGAEATVDKVLAALDGARLAHIAAHGEFRADNPMFSYLRLHDGPLTIYDLERLARAPDLVVLSACESALSEVHPGDELLGLSAALLGLGTNTVLGSVLPAVDELARDMMTTVYRAWTAGATPEAALAEAQSAAGDDIDEHTATAAAFVCFGCGTGA